MLTVEIKINGKLISKFSAINIGKARGKGEWRWYKLDCGCKLKHDRNKGFVCLLIQMTGHKQFCNKRKRKLLESPCPNKAILK